MVDLTVGFNQFRWFRNVFSSDLPCGHMVNMLPAYLSQILGIKVSSHSVLVQPFRSLPCKCCLLLYIKYTSDNGQCPTQCSCNDSIIVTNLKRIKCGYFLHETPSYNKIRTLHCPKITWTSITTLWTTLTLRIHAVLLTLVRTVSSYSRIINPRSW
jgi:hypothetical protein